METAFVSDAAVLNEMGQRIRRARLRRNLTRVELAEQAGVSLATVVRLESGKSTALWGSIRVFRALGLLDAVLDALPDDRLTPLEVFAASSRPQRKRATGAHSPHGRATTVRPWPIPVEER